MKFSRKIAVGIITASVMLVASFSLIGTAGAAKPVPPPSPPPGSPSILRVTCIDWFTNKPGTQWHAEAVVTDGKGNGVTGVEVKMQNSWSTDGGTSWTVYQTASYTTYLRAPHGTGCGTDRMTLSDIACANTQNPDGLYTSKILSVTKAGYTWDGKTPANSFTLDRS